MTEEIDLKTSESIEPGEVKSFSSPRLSAEERLYVRAYLSTLSHSKAYETLRPGLVSYKFAATNNSYSKREAVKFHIALALQERAESLSLSPEVIIERLWKEAVREGGGSNHAARIQALTQLGKHYGLFEEKKENNSHTFNIINYSPESTNLKLEEVPVELVDEGLIEDSSIQITQYN